MAKPKRGKNVKSIEGWRGTCPSCNRKRIKLLWTKIDETGNNIKCCKGCSK